MQSHTSPPFLCSIFSLGTSHHLAYFIILHLKPLPSIVCALPLKLDPPSREGVKANSFPVVPPMPAATWPTMRARRGFVRTGPAGQPCTIPRTVPAVQFGPFPALEGLYPPLSFLFLSLPGGGGGCSSPPSPHTTKGHNPQPCACGRFAGCPRQECCDQGRCASLHGAPT